MRILAVTPLYPPHSRVGAWLATHQFLARAAARGHDVTVVTRSQIRPDVAELDGVRVVGAKTDLTEAARAADVVVTHVEQGADAAVAARRPCIQMAHGGNTQVFRGVRLVVANSHTLAAEIAGDVVVCHPYTNRLDYRVARRGTEYTLINMSEAKGAGLFWRIVRSMPERRFLGVRGGYGAQLNERHPNAEVHANTQNMLDIYRRTRVLLMPSRAETWGMTAVEAMCSGIPVIAHPTPGLRESLGAAGIFVDRDDPHGWIDAIRRLDDPAEYTAWSMAARARFDEIPDHRDLFVDSIERFALVPR